MIQPEKGNKIKALVMASVVLLFLLIARSVQAQDKPYHPRQLKPVSEVFVKGLADLGNVEVFVTFKCGSNYRADWESAWVKLTGKAFAFYGADGLLHIHAFTADPPSSLNGTTPGIGYERIPDYSLQNVDETIPVEVFQYRSWYRRWQSRPCIDIAQSLLTRDRYAKAWQWLVERNQTEAIRYLLDNMGLDPNTGRIPYSQAADLSTYNSVQSVLQEIEATPHVYPAITNEGIELPDICEACPADAIDVGVEETGVIGFIIYGIVGTMLGVAALFRVMTLAKRSRERV